MARAVGVVALQVAVVVHDRVDGAGELGGRGEFVHELDGELLVRHRDARAAHLQSAKALDGIREGGVVDLEGHVAVGKAELVESAVLHRRREAVTDRVSHEADELVLSGDFHF